MMKCYREGGCGPYGGLPCFCCPASSQEYDKRKYANEAARALGEKLAACRAKVNMAKRRALMETMNEKEAEVLLYLEHSYVGARAENDLSAMIRISRALAAFKADIEDAPEAIFTEKYLRDYYME